MYEGIVFSKDVDVKWKIIRSVRGKINQVDVFINDEFFSTGGFDTAKRFIETGEWKPNKRSNKKVND
jgi:hypothetical protein